MATFTGPNLALENVSYISVGVIRCTYTQDPRQSDPEHPNDALNISNYTLSGPSDTLIIGIITVPGDTQSVDILLAGALEIGNWILAVSNIETVVADPLFPPTSLTFEVTTTATNEAVSMGAEQDNPESILRKHFNPALKGKGWDALIAAIAAGDRINWENAEKAFNQLFKASASGLYLDRITGDEGITRPENVGISDELYRKLAIKIGAKKLIEEALLEVLEVFYGEDSTRAGVTTDSVEPYSLSDGDDLRILIDERFPITVTFTSKDFAIPSKIKAIEIAAAITREFKINRLSAFAISMEDPETKEKKVRVYSGALGLSSSVRVTGGKAQNNLKFSDELVLLNGPLPTWNITVLSANKRMRFTTTGVNGLDISTLVEGDYVNIYGEEFDENNRGSFPVKTVYYAYPGGLLTQYFEVENPDGIQQLGLVQLADDSILYFRPTRKTIHTSNRDVIVSQNKAEIDIVLPATSQAVNREEFLAAYIKGNEEIEITGLTRDATGTVTVTAPGHGLSIGDHFYLDKFYPDINAPIVHAGDPVGPPATTNASIASIWSPLKDTTTSETFRHSATKLNDGRVLIAGGDDGTSPRTACELFAILGTNVFGDDAIQYEYEWQTAGSLPVAKEYHRSILLTDDVLNGKVLLCGGWNNIATVYSTSYLYTPSPPSGAGTWAATGSMGIARVLHSLILLSNEKVLATGGYNGIASVASAEIFNPSTATWSPVASMSRARVQHEQVILSNGKIFVAGGRTLATGSINYETNPGTLIGPVLNSCELYDPGLDSWTNIPSMTYARFGHKLVVLPNDFVLAIGGWGYNPTNQISPSLIRDCEIYDPNLGFWMPAGRLEVGRDFPVVEYFSDLDKIYVTGGGYTDYTSVGGSTLTEIFNVSTKKWSKSTSVLSELRDLCVGTRISDTLVLISGGTPDPDNVTPAPTKSNFLLVLGIEETLSGSLNDLYKVDSIIDSNTFSYLTVQNKTYTTKNTDSLPTLTTFKAEESEVAGPYIFDTKSGAGITGTEVTLNQDVEKGLQYQTIIISDTSDFSEDGGYIAFNYGYKNQVMPVRYLGKLSGTELVLDYSFVFPNTASSGSKVTLLMGKGIFVPDNPEELGCFYLTDSPSGRIAAENIIDEIVAEGIPVNKNIIYPGDRGLGGEGLPDKDNYKVSDVVGIWGSSNQDSDFKKARGE